MRRRKRRTPMAAFDEINMTPLLDLTFLLLIAFMITMPLMEYGTNIKAPKMNSNKLPENNFKSVTITAKGTITFDNEAVTKEQLAEKLADTTDGWSVAYGKDWSVVLEDNAEISSDLLEMHDEILKMV